MHLSSDFPAPDHSFRWGWSPDTGLGVQSTPEFRYTARIGDPWSTLLSVEILLEMRGDRIPTLLLVPPAAANTGINTQRSQRLGRKQPGRAGRWGLMGWRPADIQGSREFVFLSGLKEKLAIWILRENKLATNSLSKQCV